MDDAHKKQVRELISAQVEPRNPGVSELLIDAMSGDRPPHDILSIMESVTFLCMDGAYAAYPDGDLALTFAFRWRLDRTFSVIMKMHIDLRSAESTIEIRGGEEADDSDQWWRELHAKFQAKDADGSYRRAKALVAELFKDAGPRGSRIVEVSNGESS